VPDLTAAVRTGVVKMLRTDRPRMERRGWEWRRWAEVISLTALVLTTTARAQLTQRVSLGANGTQGNDHSDDTVSWGGRISADGRYVVFCSRASNLVPGDTNRCADVFVRDRQEGTIERVSVSSAGIQANNQCLGPAISADGRFVAFGSVSDNLVPGDTNSTSDLFVHDLRNHTTERVSVGSGGEQGNSLEGASGQVLSTDGRFVAFEDFASDLVAGDSNGTCDVFVHDRETGRTERVSVATNGAQGNGSSHVPFISADGRFVGFASTATNLVPGDTNGKADVFVHDRLTGITERVSVGTGGTQADGNSSWLNGGAIPSSISGDGRFVAFASEATNLVPGLINHTGEVLVRDRLNQTTECIDLSLQGAHGNGGSAYPSISADGRYVAFASWASDLVPGDANGKEDIFVRDRVAGSTERVSVATDGTEGDGLSVLPSMSLDARFVVFCSSADNLVVGDTNVADDSFIRDRQATGLTLLCEPGTNGAILCPCSNPPSGSERGCDNSSATGGASLSASGIAYLSMDSVVFTTIGEPPAALSVVVEGNAVLTNGVIYGQGVRCVGGTLERLFTRMASGGSISAPNFATGDPTVSAQSAAKGGPIGAGQSRWYLVFYRDPAVLGGCPATSTFNSTVTAQVTWWP
jgi:Tol biopolymer transport system component